MTILKLFTTLIITLSICVGAVWAGDVEDADAALDKKDFVTALKKYKSAAVKNDAYAQVQVGNFYNSGSFGVVQDYAEAMRWYKLAAAQGDANAQYNLGAMYATGQGVLQNNVQAHMWFNIAAANGDKDAVKNRDIVASKMTTEQIGQAQRLAKECQARNYKNCE